MISTYDARSIDSFESGKEEEVSADWNRPPLVHSVRSCGVSETEPFRISLGVPGYRFPCVQCGHNNVNNVKAVGEK